MNEQNTPLPELETRELMWIFQEAGESLEKQHKDTETAYFRASQHSPHEKILSMSPVSRTYGEVAESLKNQILSIERRLRFCKGVKERLADVSAKEFAQAFRNIYKK